MKAEELHAKKGGRTPFEWGMAACEAIMAAYSPEELPPAGRWHYHQGVFLCGMEKLMDIRDADPRHGRYIRDYVDALVDRDGNLLFARDELDSIQAGLLLFRLDRISRERRYRIAADKLRALFGTLNRTSEGGFWHKDKYPGQMWLDGLYMGGVFALKYAKEYGDDRLIETVLRQEELMRGHLRDSRTGLLFHAWDEYRRMPWADPITGRSPEFWGRSLGWYGLALAEFLDLLPEGAAGRSGLEEALRDFVRAIVRYQDQASGLWYQVVDKGDRADNWLETSCTSLFVYTIASAVRQGVAEREYAGAAELGYLGLIDRLSADERGKLIVPDICVGTSAGDYDNYVTRPKSANDLHGVGAFAMACAAMHELRGLSHLA